MKCIFWDMCGDQRFNSLIRSFYKSGDAVIYVYDITNSESFLNLETWMSYFENLPNHQQPKVKLILGNKNESYKKMVDFDSASAFAKKHNINILEVSAKNGTNINEAFTWLTEALAEVKMASERPRIEVEFLDSKSNSESSEANGNFLCCKKFW